MNGSTMDDDMSVVLPVVKVDALVLVVVKAELVVVAIVVAVVLCEDPVWWPLWWPSHHANPTCVQHHSPFWTDQATPSEQL